MTYRQPFPGTPKNKKKEWIYLKDVLKHFGPFKVKEPIAYLVGGLCNFRKTQGDIDILINLPQNEAGTSIAKVLKFRIYRSLPPKLWPRIHILYNDGAGPFTSYVPLFYLSAEILSKQRQEMSISKVKPLKFFKQLKGKFGRIKKETFTIKGLIDKVPAADYPLEIDKKFDGMRVQIHAAAGSVKIFSEDGGNVTDRFPSIVKELKGKNLVLDCEMTGEVKGKPLGRSDVSGYAHTKGKPYDAPFTANCFDIIYNQGRDLHLLPLSERRNILKELPKFSKINIIKAKKANNPDQLEKAVNWAMKLPASEGAMIKSLASFYELDGTTNHWWKFKKELDIDAKVVKVNKITNTNTFNYLCIIDSNIPIGLTYNTNIKANVGDIIKVFLGNLNKYIDEKKNKVWFNWVFPRVAELREDKKTPDNKETAESIVKESGGFVAKKPWPKRYETLDGNFSDIRQNLVEHKLKYAIRHHYRGKSIHADIAFEKPDKTVDAYVLDVMKAKEIPKPVLTVKQAISEDSKAENFKINYKTGEIPNSRKILVQQKDTKKRVFSEDITGISPPGGIGATKNYPGVFHVMDKGTYAPGARKKYFYEYFIKGEKFKGRYIFRKIPRSGRWAEAGKEPFVWFFWKPLDQTPYILSSRGISRADFPIGKTSLSWLPSEWEKKIPDEMKWWGRDLTRAGAVNRLKSARKLLLSKELLSLPYLFVTERTQENAYGQMLEDNQIELIAELSSNQTLSRNDIAEKVGCSKSCVYVWQRKLDII